MPTHRILFLFPDRTLQSIRDWFSFDSAGLARDEDKSTRIRHHHERTTVGYHHVSDALANIDSVFFSDVA